MRVYWLNPVTGNVAESTDSDDVAGPTYGLVAAGHDSTVVDSNGGLSAWNAPGLTLSGLVRGTRVHFV